MNLLTDNNVIVFIGTVTKGTYPEADPSRELYKITKGENVYYAVTEGFELQTVETVPEQVVEIKWCYTQEDGFYENPDWQPSPEEKMAELQNTVDLLVVELLGGN